MGFFDNFINTGKNVVSTAGKKTDSAVKLSKLRIKETQINNDIRAKYEKLGELCYQAYKSGEKNEDELNDQLTGLDNCYNELEEIARLTDELKSMVTCPKCGAKHKDDAAYCSVCGAKLPEKAKPEPKTESTESDEESGDKED